MLQYRVIIKIFIYKQNEMPAQFLIELCKHLMVIFVSIIFTNHITTTFYNCANITFFICVNFYIKFNFSILLCVAPLVRLWILDKSEILSTPLLNSVISLLSDTHTSCTSLLTDIPLTSIKIYRHIYKAQYQALSFRMALS